MRRRGGLEAGDFVVEFIGEVYPPWRWFEKQDGIRNIQKKESVAEFYNIYLERPRVGNPPPSHPMTFMVAAGRGLTDA